MRARLFRERLHAIDAKAAVYADFGGSPEEITAYQLVRLNSAWERAHSNLRFYREFKDAIGAPESFASLDEYATLPTLSKSVLQERSDDIFADAPDSRALKTGGSSGAPLKLPYGPSESLDRYALSYYFRERLGLRPFDPYMHIWGHSHLFGAGLMRPVRLVQRALGDRLVRGHRFSANVLSKDTRASMVDALSGDQYRYLIGYSGAVLSLADTILEENVARTWSRLRQIIVTAENCYPHELERIRAAFQRPVAQEYGAAETGVIAHTGLWGHERYEVGWSDILLEVDGAGSVLVTTLAPRRFPLFRYELGDAISGATKAGPSVLSFGAVEGRVVDLAMVPQIEGESVAMRAGTIMHLFKGVSGIDTVQFSNPSDGSLRLFYHSTNGLQPGQVQAAVIPEFQREFPKLAVNKVVFVALDQPSRTLAGKRSLRRVTD